MADLDRRYAQGTTVGRTDAGVVDQGLRAYMLRVYNYMASGAKITTHLKALANMNEPNEVSSSPPVPCTTDMA